MLTNASFCLKFYRKIAFYSKYCSTRHIALVFAGLPRKKKCKVVFICALNDVHIRPTVGDGNQSRKSLFAIQQMTRATRWHNSRHVLDTNYDKRIRQRPMRFFFFFLMWLALWELHTLLKLSFFLSAWVSNRFLPTNLRCWWVQHPAAVLKEQGSKPIVAPTWVSTAKFRTNCLGTCVPQWSVFTPTWITAMWYWVCAAIHWTSLMPTWVTLMPTWLLTFCEQVFMNL